jgi:hypothetical protein
VLDVGDCVGEGLLVIEEIFERSFLLMGFNEVLAVDAIGKAVGGE